MASEAPVLLVSVSAGSRHMRAAHALEQAFAMRHPELDVMHVDLLRLARPRWVGSAYGGSCGTLAERAPRLWGDLYRWTDGPAPAPSPWGGLAEPVLFGAFRRLLEERPWRACVCTHFLPAQLAAGRPGVPPFAMVVTDWVLHRFWVHPSVDDFFVASAEQAAELRSRVPNARVSATGIPVDPRFGTIAPPAIARRELGLDPERPTLLVMGGGES